MHDRNLLPHFRIVSYWHRLSPSFRASIAFVEAKTIRHLRRATDSFTDLFKLVINHIQGVCTMKLTSLGRCLCVNMSFPINLSWRFYTLGCNWRIKHSIISQKTCFWHAWHDGLRDEWGTGLRRLSAAQRRRLTADKKLFESRDCIVNTYLRVASNIRLVSSQMRPRQKHTFISSQLVPHSAQITIRSLWKKKKPRHKQNKLSKHSDLKRRGERRGRFKEKIRLLGLKKREKKYLSREMDISPLSEQVTTLAACQASLTSHFLLVMLTVTLMYSLFPS